MKDCDDPQSSPNSLIDLDLVPSLMTYGDSGCMQEDDDDNASDESSTSNVSHDEVEEQTTHEPQNAPQVYRSTRERQLSRRYSIVNMFCSPMVVNLNVLMKHVIVITRVSG